MPYDDARFTRKESHANNLTSIASTSFQKFLYFAKTKVKKVHALVNVAGTNASAGIDIFNGTTSVGEIVLGTNTVGSTASSGALNTEIAAMGVLDLKGKANSSTLAVSISVEEEVLHDAAFSA